MKRDPEAHLEGTPWWNWRAEAAKLLGITPFQVSCNEDAYAEFVRCVTPEDYVKSIAS